MTPAVKVDAHHHFWDLGVRDQPWIPDGSPIRRDFGPADLAPLAARAGITATVLVQTVAVAEETPEFLATAAADDLVAAVVGWVDLTAPDVADRLAELRAAPGGELLRGIRHLVQGEPDPEWLCRPDVRRGLAEVARAGLVYDLLVLPHQLPAAIRTVADLPDLSFVLDHCAKPRIADQVLDPWADRIRELAGHPNVVCKLSGLVTEAAPDWTVADLRPYVEVALDAFGPDRLMAGSDWPVCLLAAEYADVWATTDTLLAELSGAERDRILGDTAQRVYRL